MWIRKKKTLISICKCEQIYPLCIQFIFPPLLTDLPHPAAVQQVNYPSVLSSFLLPPCLPDSLVLTIKKTANLSGRRHNCHYDCCGPAHQTQCSDCSTGEEGANTVCSVQTPHNIIIAWLQLIHTCTQSLYLTLLSSPQPHCNLSIKCRTNKSFYRPENPYTTAFLKKKIFELSSPG